MSPGEAGQNEGVAYLNSRLEEMMTGLAKSSPEDFIVRLLEKLIADGYIELKPGCSKDQTAHTFAAAFKNLKLKMPAGS
jgi:hypothetical protein